MRHNVYLTELCCQKTSKRKLSIYKHNKKLTANAKMLRSNMTSQERNLWHKYLKRHTVRILRQKVLGNFIVDFYCSRAKLVIELDGSQHFNEGGMEHDTVRTKYIESHGIKVIRFTNVEVDENFEGVCNLIDLEIKKRIE